MISKHHLFLAAALLLGGVQTSSAFVSPQKHNIITRVVKCDFNSFIGITWMAQKYENEEVQQRQPENIAKKDPKL